MKKAVGAALLGATVFLASCGGGDPPEPASLAQASLAKADLSACSAPSPDYAMVGGECLKVFKAVQPQRAAVPPQRFVPVLTSDVLFDWAQGIFPQFFSGNYSPGQIGAFQYRFYPDHGNYLAVANGGVYVLGPISGNQVMYIAPLADFTCSIYSCDVPASSATSSILQVGGSLIDVIDSGGDADWHAVFLNAGGAYVFNLEGSPTGQGTLTDPFLALYNPSSQLLEQNDDISDADRNSRITYSATSTGWYYLSAQGFSTNTGSYRLSASLAGSSGGGGGPGGTVNWNSSISAEEIVQFSPTLAVGAREGWTFEVSGGPVSVETIFVAQYSANLYITTGDTSLESCVNGGGFNHIPAHAFVGQFGFQAFTLAPGTYGVCVENTANTPNGMRVEFQNQPTVVGFHYLQQRFNTVAQSVPAGGRYVQPVTIGDTYRVIIDGANSGGSFYVIPSTESSNFANGSAFSFYQIDCASGRAAPGLCELKGVGENAVIAYHNDTSSPQSIVIVGRDYVPD